MAGFAPAGEQGGACFRRLDRVREENRKKNAEEEGS
jgi:hypothetical protein